MNNSLEITVAVTLPQSLLFENNLSEKEASDALLRAFVLSLYRRDRISSGKAARLLGMHRLAFIQLLAEENIPYLDYAPEELETELETIQKWTKR